MDFGRRSLKRVPVRRGSVRTVVRRIRAISGSAGSARKFGREKAIVHRLLKRAIITGASAMGFRPGNEQWIALLVRLEGEFERSRSELALEIMALVFNAGIVFVLAAFAIK